MEWKINQIQELKENEAKRMALEEMTIKGHQVYFVDFGGHFKYSALVFAEGRHIYYANEYELHYAHLNGDLIMLHDKYVTYLTRKLFTEEELMQGIENYDEYQRKSDFLRNYYSMRKENISAFLIAPSKEEERRFRKKTSGLFFNPVSYAYYFEEDFVKKCLKLRCAVEKAWEERNKQPEVMKEAFIREMYDHEYAISWDPDYDTLSAFGNIEHKSGDVSKALQSYFDQLNFTDDQRKAYFEARKEYYRQIGEETAG